MSQHRWARSHRLGLGFLAVTGLCFASFTAAQPDDRPRYSEVVRESAYVRVRDGTQLAMQIYRPAENGVGVATPYPVVFLFTPYRARFKDADGVINETGLSPRLGLAGLTGYGYVVAVADIRGKGASFGSRRGFQDRTEALDGRDLIAWLAAQTWSTGQVGMLGCSYLGGTALHVATTAPPALKAIFVGATDLDKYAFVRRGGITAQFNTRPDEPASYDLMSVPLDADRDGSMLAAAVAEHAGNTPMAALWYGMPYRDSLSELTGTRFWQEVGPYTYLDVLEESGIATYFWGNWQDEPTGQVILAAANLGGKLLIGPGRHCNPPPGFDFAGEIRRYFDRYLKNIDNGIDREPLYTYWIDNAPAGQEWRQSAKLPGADTVRTTWYLDTSSTQASGDSGALAPRPGGERRQDLVIDYELAPPSAFSFWPEPRHESGLLRYTGPILEADTTLLGSPVLELTVSADRDEAYVFAYLEDLAPDGRLRVVSLGRLAASHRALGASPYDSLGLPWHSGNRGAVSPLPAGQPARLRFDLTPAGWVFAAGHRIRLTIAGADSRQRNLALIRDDLATQLSLWLGGEDASRLELPFKNENTAELSGRPAASDRSGR